MPIIAPNLPINFLGFRLSDHLIKERADRYMDIQMNVSFGSKFVVVVEVGDKYECLTNTGVVMVIAKQVVEGKRLLITTYVGSIEKASAMFHHSGSRLPSFVVSAINKANKNRTVFE